MIVFSTKQNPKIFGAALKSPPSQFPQEICAVNFVKNNRPLRRELSFAGTL